MSKKIRVLHVVTIMDVGGIETTIMNYLRNVDRSKVHFDFLVHRERTGFFDEEIKLLGANIYHAPAFSLKNMRNYSVFMNDFFKRNTYDIVHSHLDALSYFPLKAAKKKGIPVRIAHSHVNGFDRNLSLPLRELFKRLIPYSATNFMACSQTAGEFMFGKQKFDILLNPIHVDMFKFNKKNREELRSNLGFNKKIVIGHVGRFDIAKNHKFILEIAKELPSDVFEFVFIGDGVLRSEIMEEAKSLGLNNLRFLGIKEDIYTYLSSFDALILPSFYEGLGIVAIEAQVNGLPVFISEGVSPNVIIADNVFRLKLDHNTWVNRLSNVPNLIREESKFDFSIYDVDINSINLLNSYHRYLEEN